MSKHRVEFDDFFRKHQKNSGKQGINWERRRREWVKAVEELYAAIRDEYLKGSIKAGLVSVSERSKNITEDYIGTYSIPELILQVGDQQVVFSPKGRNIIGGTGRIDLQGPLGEKTIVAQPGRWNIVASRTPTLRTVPLDATSLLGALQEVMGE